MSEDSWTLVVTTDGTFHPFTAPALPKERKADSRAKRTERERRKGDHRPKTSRRS